MDSVLYKMGFSRIVRISLFSALHTVYLGYDSSRWLSSPCQNYSRYVSHSDCLPARPAPPFALVLQRRRNQHWNQHRNIYPPQCCNHVPYGTLCRRHRFDVASIFALGKSDNRTIVSNIRSSIVAFNWCRLGMAGSRWNLCTAGHLDDRLLTHRVI